VSIQDLPAEPVVAPAATATARPRVLARIRARGADPEYGVSALLLGLGILVLIQTTQISAAMGERGPVGPKAFPTAIGVGLLVVAVLHALDVLRGGHGEAEAGEDIELGHPADWKTVGLLAGAFVANIALIEPLGWPLSGALLFWGGTFALGSRAPLRDLPIALAMGFGSYYLFANALGLYLPAGPLEGVI
jgi:putative tricarboxylic transport membrane protein